jgi:hypothetical protein
MVAVNMSKVSSGFELLEENDYWARFAKFDVRKAGPTAQNPGAPYFNLEFHLDKEHHPDLGNRRMWGSMGTSIDSLWAAKSFLVACGYPSELLDDEDEGEDPSALSQDELVAALRAMLDKVKGGLVVLKVVIDDYEKSLPNGDTVPAQRNKIAKYISVYDAAAA